MSSAVEIANQALVLLGARPVISFDDNTVEANVLKVMYEPIKRQLLRSFPWRCATKTVTLATHLDPPVDPKWEYAHAWPQDAIRILGVMEAGGTMRHEVAWESAGSQILTKADEVVSTYIANIAEPNMDSHVEMALVAQLALDLSYTLTASNTREANLAAMHKAKMDEARTTDRQEASHTKFRVSRLDDVRH